nr:hypothetical protein [Tanacetum cinerariifolium]
MVAKILTSVSLIKAIVCMIVLTPKEAMSVLAFGGNEATLEQIGRVAYIQQGQSLLAAMAADGDGGGNCTVVVAAVEEVVWQWGWC